MGGKLGVVEILFVVREQGNTNNSGMEERVDAVYSVLVAAVEARRSSMPFHDDVIGDENGTEMVERVARVVADGAVEAGQRVEDIPVAQMAAFIISVADECTEERRRSSVNVAEVVPAMGERRQTEIEIGVQTPMCNSTIKTKSLFIACAMLVCVAGVIVTYEVMAYR